MVANQSLALTFCHSLPDQHASTNKRCVTRRSIDRSEQRARGHRARAEPLSRLVTRGELMSKGLKIRFVQRATQDASAEPCSTMIYTSLAHGLTVQPPASFETTILACTSSLLTTSLLPSLHLVLLRRPDNLLRF